MLVFTGDNRIALIGAESRYKTLIGTIRYLLLYLQDRSNDSYAIDDWPDHQDSALSACELVLNSFLHFILVVVPRNASSSSLTVRPGTLESQADRFDGLQFH